MCFMKNIILLTIILLIGTVLTAQEVISSGGETQSASGYEISWTIGEPVIETFTGSTNILTQGFHQSKLTVTPITEFLNSRIELKVFPNPTSDFVLIQFNELVENSGYTLFNLTGKVLESELLTSTSTKLDLKNYASGQYILKLTKNSTQPLQTFKIIKR